MIRRVASGLVAMLVAAATMMGAAGPAAAGIYQQVLHVYEREGSVPACQFTSRQLQAALAGVDTYGAQYFADFTQAVQAALNSRAGGACTAPVAGATAAVRAASRLPPPPELGLTAGTSAGVPLPLAVLGGLALVAVAAGGGVLVGRRRRPG